MKKVLTIQLNIIVTEHLSIYFIFSKRNDPMPYNTIAAMQFELFNTMETAGIFF